MPRLADSLTDVTRIGLDTMSVIYYVEMNPQYLPIADEIFERIDGGQLFGVASTVTLAVAETAADLRARHSIRTADSVVAATAIQAGCQALVTNDDRLQRLTELRVIFLDDTTL